MFCAAFLDTTKTTKTTTTLRLFATALTLLSLLPAPVSAALKNATIDDQDLSLISYINPIDWLHDPLVGWEYQFYNGSRSYTWVPGASASLTFTGSGVYLQGPPAPDQAQRRVFLDGRDMGAFNLKAPDREYCTVFFSATQLPYTTHTIVVAHNDTPTMIFAMDAWFVEFDDTQSILPFTTTTTTQTAATHTITSTPTDTNGLPINGTISGSPNTPDQNEAHPKSYSTIIVAIVVPVVLFLLFCIVGLCIWRNRRTRHAQRRRESFREKFLGRGGGPIGLSSPLSPAFAAGAAGAGGRYGRDSDDSRAGAMSPHTFASTRYSTALDHEYNSDQDHSRNQLSSANPASPHPMVIAPANILDPRVLSDAMSSGRNNSSTSLIGLSANANTNAMANMSPIRPTFDPPAEWRTTLSRGADVPHTNTNTNTNTNSLSHDSNHVDLLTASGTAAAGTAAISGRPARSSPDAYRNLTSNPKPNPNPNLNPSTVFSETESAYSLPPGPGPGLVGVGLGAPPARHYQLQDVRNSTATGTGTGTGRDAEGGYYGTGNGNDFGSPPASPTAGPSSPNRSNSVLKRFSTAITSTLPFARVGSRPNSRHSNSHAMSTTTTNANANTNAGGNGTGNGTRDSIGAGGAAGYTGTSRNSEDVENNGSGGRGYFRGMNHFNLGIPLNYRPTATANNPHAPSPATSPTSPGQGQGQGIPNTRMGRHSGEMNRSTTAPTTPGSALVQSPFDDTAFSSYTRQTRDRVLNYPTTPGEGEGVGRALGATGTAGTHSTPPVAPVSSLDSSEAGGGANDVEPEEKDEKIIENLDGETMHGEAGDNESRWSVGHGTLASNGGVADGVTRTGSLGRQRSVRSTADQGRGVIPPPYSVYIPPDTKTSPPPGHGSQ